MAYSKNIRQLVICLSGSGHSAEEISENLSDLQIKSDQEGLSSFCAMGKTYQIAFTESDWSELKKRIPDPKTIRRWSPDVKGGNHDSFKDKRVEPDTAFNYPGRNPGKLSENNNVSKACQASPDNMDTNKLKKLEIPGKNAPEVLREWRSYHRKGEHEFCLLYARLIEDIQVREIPFLQAQGLLELGIRAITFHSQKLQRNLESVKAYRPWESLESNRSFFKEFNELRKPGPLRQKHLGGITELLIKFQKEVEKAREENQLDIRFSVEQDALFKSMIEHCQDIQWHFGEFTFQRLERDHKQKHSNLEKKRNNTLKHLHHSITRCLKDWSYLNRLCSICIQLDTK